MVAASPQIAKVPTSIREFYNPDFKWVNSPKWGENLFYRHRNARFSVTDLAEICLALYEKERFIAFSTREDTFMYMTDNMHVWVPVNRADLHEIGMVLIHVSTAIRNHVITKLEELLHDWRRAAAAELEVRGDKKRDNLQKQAHIQEGEDHLKELNQMCDKLRSSQAGTIAKRMITKLTAQTKEDEICHDVLDTKTDCMAFRDFVFDFRSANVAREGLGYSFYQTLSTGFDYEEVLLRATPEAYADYDGFMDRVYANREVRDYLIDLLASSALNEARQVIVIHHNVVGSNGKTTMFSLIKKVFGDYFVKCDSRMLAQQSFVSTGPNEELVSCKGKRIVLVSEPSANLKLSASFIKELTGGDEQSTRANYGKKQTFVFRGILHVLCNKIPEVDDMCGGMQRRLRCIPYGSRFVDEADHVDPSKNVYLKEVGLETKFEESFKYCLAKDVLEAAVQRVQAGYPNTKPPAVVMASTQELIQRESAFEGFKAACLVNTGKYSDTLSYKEAYEEYVKYCAEKKKPAEAKGKFKEHMLGSLGSFAPYAGGKKNFWRCWQVVKVEEAEADDFLD